MRHFSSLACPGKRWTPPEFQVSCSLDQTWTWLLLAQSVVAVFIVSAVGVNVLWLLDEIASSESVSKSSSSLLSFSCLKNCAIVAMPWEKTQLFHKLQTTNMIHIYDGLLPTFPSADSIASPFFLLVYYIGFLQTHSHAAALFFFEIISCNSCSADVLCLRLWSFPQCPPTTRQIYNTSGRIIAHVHMYVCMHTCMQCLLSYSDFMWKSWSCFILLLWNGV